MIEQVIERQAEHSEGPESFCQPLCIRARAVAIGVIV